MNSSQPMITIYTDGSCLPRNPGPGGWAFVALTDRAVWEISGGSLHSTNNRMELQAAVEALIFFRGEELRIYTDSEYVQKGMTQWIHGWKARDWYLVNGNPVKNKDLWQQLDRLNSSRIDWCWVKAHNGQEHNERADELAKEAARHSGKRIPKKGKKRITREEKWKKTYDTARREVSGSRDPLELEYLRESVF